MSDKLKVAVIEGFHPFDVIGYHEMWRSFDTIDYYPQTIENWAVAPPEYRAQYDALVFYNMNMDFTGNPFADAVMAAIDAMGDTEQGIFLLHHAILSLPENESLNEMIGIKNRAFGFHIGQEYEVQVANDTHPITKGMKSFKVVDETYTMDNADDTCDVLLTTDYGTSMDTLAWTKTYKNARVFNFQLGHDNLTWVMPEFRQIVSRGIEWVAKRI